jgi:hypothetical protein
MFDLTCIRSRHRGLVAAVQLLATNFDSKQPMCPLCQRRLHRHGHYLRRKKGRIIPRWLCSPCQRTFSILPPDLLPYRDFSCGELQDEFDRWAFEDCSPASKPAASALRSFLEPTMQRDLQLACGQLLDIPLAVGKELWRGLRRFCPSAEGLLGWLVDHSGLSLLGRYVCHQESRRNLRTPRSLSAAALNSTIPHNFPFPNHTMAPAPGHGFG